MRKNLFRKRATLLALFLGVVMTSIAQTTFTINKLNYQVNEDGTSVTVTGHTDGYEATGELEIPASVNYNEKDYTVTAVGQSAFMYCFYLSKLTLPNTITTIGEGAFSYCQSFKGDLVIPNSVKEVGYKAFSECSGFDGLLIIGSSVESLGDYAFSGCAGLTGTLNLPANVTSIGSNTFGSNGFGAIVVDPDNSVYDSREQCNAIVETNTNTLITGCKNSIIPEGITDIGYCAFRGILNLTAVELPQSLVTIGENAFALCYDLTGDLTIPDLVTTIGPSAFYGCEKLTGTLTLGESVSYIGDWAFKKCSGFTGAVSRATTPPEIGNEFGYYTAFESFGCQILIIPDGCTDAYMNSNLHDELGLCGFSTFIEESDNISEYDIKCELENAFKKYGAVSQSFTSIVAKDENSALAHYSKSSKTEIIKDGSLVLIDCGGFYKGGLATDCTRVFVKGTPSELQKQIYTLVLKSFLLAFNKKDFECGQDIDKAAREFLEKNAPDGFVFNHGLGHGIGVNVHDNPPRLACTGEESLIPIQDNMCFTIEPGLYKQNVFGVRLENSCYFENGEIKSFTNMCYEKKLIDYTMLTDSEKEQLSHFEVK